MFPEVLGIRSGEQPSRGCWDGFRSQQPLFIAPSPPGLPQESRSPLVSSRPEPSWHATCQTGQGLEQMLQARAHGLCPQRDNRDLRLAIETAPVILLPSSVMWLARGANREKTVLCAVHRCAFSVSS